MLSLVTTGRSLDLAAALVAAVGYGTSSVLQALGARDAAAGTAYRHPWYIAGSALDVLAWSISLVALRALPVYEVQAVLALSVAVTALLARPVLGTVLRGRDTLAIGVSIAGLAMLAASSAPARPPTDGAPRYVLAAAAPIVLLLGIAAARAARPATATALLAGAGFGVAALCAQEIVLPQAIWSLHTVSVLAREPLTYALVVSAAAGAWLYAVALEHGEVGPVTALLWISEVIVPSALGAVLFHAAFRAGWTVPGLAGVAAILAATVVLGRQDRLRVP